MIDARDLKILVAHPAPMRAECRADQNLQVASIDHALWIHDDVDCTQWLLYATDGPWTGNARAFARGQFFSADGRLVASTAQEGLMRFKPED
jgi:acyl-CoA thioesterase-2